MNLPSGDMERGVPYNYTVVMVRERGDPEREGEAQEEVDVGENERATISGVSQKKERRVESSSTRPHLEIPEQLEMAIIIMVSEVSPPQSHAQGLFDWRQQG